MLVSVLWIEFFSTVIKQDRRRTEIAEGVRDVGAHRKPGEGFVIAAQIKPRPLLGPHILEYHFQIAMGDAKPLDTARVVMIAANLPGPFEGDKVDLAERSFRLWDLTAAQEFDEIPTWIGMLDTFGYLEVH